MQRLEEENTSLKKSNELLEHTDSIHALALDEREAELQSEKNGKIDLE